MLGQVVGSYRIVSTVGAGGMGVVYLGEHQVIGRRAAIKVLLPELSHNREVVERFFNEARASALIRHQGIVDILDFGHAPDGSAFIVMEYLEGESLGARLRRVGRLPEAGAVTIVRQAAGALAAAHAQGIIHRDLKPDNLYLVPDPDLIGGARVKILDFGIAKLTTPGAGQTVAKTRTGAVMGSPLYMSPEQSRGARTVDERSDIYSLGCVLFEMLAGRPPFVAEGAGEVIGMHIYEKPPRLRALERSVSPALDALVARTLAKNPESRPRSMNDLIQAIDKATGSRYATQSTADVIAVPRPPAASPSPTTLGNSIGEITSLAEPARRRRWPLALASVAIVGVVAGAIASVASSTNDAAPAAAAAVATASWPDAGRVAAPPPAPPPAVAAPLPAVAAPPPPVAAPPPADAAPAAPPPAVTPVARSIKLRLTTSPSGAKVSVSGGPSATTPCELELPWSAEVEARLHVSLEGYRDEDLRLLPDRDRSRDLELRPLKREPEPRPPSPPPRIRAKGDPVDPFAP